MHWLLMSLLLAFLPPPEAGHGTLTVVVRDESGAALAGVTIALFHDTDDGRVLVGIDQTDATGQRTYVDLPWGLYIVQFQGTAPDGRAMLSPARQNQGALDDGGGVANGFGVRLAEVERTELYVLGSLPGEAAAVPKFDMAASAADPPVPYDPLPQPVVSDPTPFTLRDVVEGRVQMDGQPVRGRWDGWCLAGLGLLIWAGGVLVALGWWRVRSEKGGPRARLDT